MKKTVAALFFSVLFVMHADYAYCAGNSAEQHVKNFYRWYITECLRQKQPLKDKTIYKYLDRCLIENIDISYKRGYSDVDYVTKSQEIWRERLDILIVHKVVNVDGVVSIVPITFKFDEKLQQHLIVFVRKEKDAWRITKIAGRDFFD